MALVEHVLHFVVCLPRRLETGGRDADFIVFVSLPGKYDSNGTEGTEWLAHSQRVDGMAF